MNSDPPSTTRRVLILASAIDAILSGIVLLIYFRLLPVDLSALGIPHYIVGIVGGIWFLTALAILVYQLTKTDRSE